MTLMSSMLTVFGSADRERRWNCRDRTVNSES